MYRNNKIVVLCVLQQANMYYKPVASVGFMKQSVEYAFCMYTYTHNASTIYKYITHMFTDKCQYTDVPSMFLQIEMYPPATL